MDELMEDHLIDVYINCTLRGHLLEDAKAMLYYKTYPAEPDVGDMYGTVEFAGLFTTRGRLLKHITKALSERDMQAILDQVL